MNIQESIKELQKNHGYKVKEPIIISFGEKETIKKAFIEAFKIGDQTVKDFKWYVEYDEVIDWMSDNKGKGLMLIGSSGCGKSIILTKVLPALFLCFKRKILRVYKSRDIARMDIDELYRYMKRNYIAVDEFGREKDLNEFGTKHNAMEYVIDECETDMKLLFITSNLNIKQVSERYGEHILDRLKLLCKIVVFKGESLRS